MSETVSKYQHGPDCQPDRQKLQYVARLQSSEKNGTGDQDREQCNVMNQGSPGVPLGYRNRITQNEMDEEDG